MEPADSGDSDDDSEEVDEAVELYGRVVENMPWASIDDYGVPQLVLVHGELAPCEWPGRVAVRSENLALKGQTFEHAFARRYLARDDHYAFNIKGLSTGLIGLLKRMQPDQMATITFLREQGPTGHSV